MLSSKIASGSQANSALHRGLRISALASAVLFVVGISLLGSSKAAGYFYAASVAIGAPAFFAMKPFHIRISSTILIYSILIIAFWIFCGLYILIGKADISILDYTSRFLLGAMNGWFFWLLFDEKRSSLFGFIIVVAAASALVSMSVSIFQGIDLTTMAIQGARSSGVTAATNFALLITVPLGLVALALANRSGSLGNMVALTLLVSVGLFAVMLTGTRGILPTFPWLFLLLVIALRQHFSPLAIVALVMPMLLAGGFVGFTLFQRNLDIWQLMSQVLTGDYVLGEGHGSAGLRMDMWYASWLLIQEEPWFGHGFDSFPEVLNHPSISIPDDSLLWGFGEVHNQILDITLRGGLVGAFLLFAPLVVALVAGARMVFSPNDRIYGLMLIWVVGAYFLGSFTDIFFGIASSTLQLAVFVGMLLWLVPGCQIPIAKDRDPMTTEQ